MKHIRRTLAWHCAIVAACVAAVALAATPLAAQRVRGHVVDSTGAPISSARILILPDSARATSDDSGKFTVGPLRPGSHVLRARRIGYVQTIETLTTPLAGDSLRIAMTPTPVMLAAVRTIALEQKLPRLFVRQRERLGAQLYGDALTDVLSRVSGLTVEELLPFDRTIALKLLSTRGCPDDTYVDGILARAPIAFYIDDKDIAAVEVFTSPDFVHEPFIDAAGYPAGECRRLVLIWSKEYQQRPWGGH